MEMKKVQKKFNEINKLSGNVLMFLMFLKITLLGTKIKKGKLN